MSAPRIALIVTCILSVTTASAECRVAPLKEGLKLSAAAFELRGALFMHLCSQSATPIVDGDDATMQKRIDRPQFSLPRIDYFYPPAALRKRIQGTATYVLLFEVDGQVSQYALVESSGSEVLDKAALNGLSGMRVKAPGLLDGMPTRMLMTFPVGFKITGG